VTDGRNVCDRNNVFAVRVPNGAGWALPPEGKQRKSDSRAGKYQTRGGRSCAGSGIGLRRQPELGARLQRYKMDAAFGRFPCFLSERSALGLPNRIQASEC